MPVHAKRLKHTLINILTLRLQEKAGHWVHGAVLEKIAQSYGYEGETAKRKLREMTQPGHSKFNPLIKEMYVDGCILYQFKRR